MNPGYRLMDNGLVLKYRCLAVKGCCKLLLGI